MAYLSEKIVNFVKKHKGDQEVNSGRSGRSWSATAPQPFVMPLPIAYPGKISREARIKIILIRL